MISYQTYNYLKWLTKATNVHATKVSIIYKYAIKASIFRKKNTTTLFSIFIIK